MKSQHADRQSQKMERAWVFDDTAELNTPWLLPASRLLKEITYSNDLSPYHLSYLLLAVKYILTHADFILHSYNIKEPN